MPTSKTTQSKIKKGVADAVAARNKTRVRPALAHLARMPGSVEDLRDLTSYVRKARDHLQQMASKTAEAHAKIDKDKEAEYKHWGMVEGEKPGHWIDELGTDRRIVARNRAIEAAKKEHAKSTEGPRQDTIQALREVRTDLNKVDPLFHNQISMLLRSTLGDARAGYMRVLQGAGVVAINSAILDAIMGEGNRPLGAAIIQILEQDDKLAARIPYTREEIADVLVHDQYWEARQWIGLAKYHIEQSEVAVLTLEGKSISTDRKMKAGLMRAELEKAVGKSFNEEGDEVDPEGKIVTVPLSKSHESYYAGLLAESRANDARIVAEKRKQVAAAKKAAEKEAIDNLNMTEAEENLRYGGPAFAESMKS